MENLLSDSITLLVKSPATNICDQQIEARLDWTVEKLKGHLEDIYPNKPKTQWQKLIYCGRLLSDRLLLRDIFRHISEGEVQTIHLVCSTLANSVCKEIPPAIVRGSGPTMSAGSQELRYRRSNESARHVEQSVSSDQTLAETSPPSEQQVPAEIPTAFYHRSMPLPVDDEYLQNIQHMYAHYWQQMSAWNAVTSQMYQAQVGGVSDSVQVEGGSPEQVQAQVAAPEPPAVARPPPAAAAAQRNNDDIVLDAQGRVIEADGAGEDGELNDWLDWLYVGCRVAVILSIIYFYSSMGRFIMVSALLGLVFVLYILRRDWQQEAAGAGAAAPQQPAAAAAAPQQPAAAEAEQPQEEPQPPSMIQTLTTFVYNFFASLVPEMPQA